MHIGNSDVEETIILQLPYDDLKKLCQSNKMMYSFCKTNNVLQSRFRRINDIIKFVFDSIPKTDYDYRSFIHGDHVHIDFIISNTLTGDLLSNIMRKHHIKYNLRSFNKFNTLSIFYYKFDEYAISIEMSNPKSTTYVYVDKEKLIPLLFELLYDGYIIYIS
ncbi:MAG TPA: hypothetical protein VLG50_08115 [Candidatus Saccharimonadales bacterium]|nr:hypothetical protein [Candidatus Saccharimonadales bacterium]